MQYRSDQFGLTLIELMISLVIISIVVTLTANGFIFGNRIWTKVDSNQHSLDEIASAQRFMRKALSQAVFYTLDNDENKDNYFNGDTDKMLFLAPSPQYGLDDYLYIYEIFKQKEGGLYHLSLRYVPANSYFSGSVRNAKRHVKLLRDVSELKFQYYGYNKLTGQLAWYETWLNQDTLPILVSISTQTRTGKAWPKLIVETKHGAYLLP